MMDVALVAFEYRRVLDVVSLELRMAAAYPGLFQSRPELKDSEVPGTRNSRFEL